MNINDWRELRGRFVQAIENTPVGSYSLEGARMAPEVFQYSSSPELTASILYNAWIDPKITAEQVRTIRSDVLVDFLADEEEARIEAGVLEPAEGM